MSRKLQLAFAIFIVLFICSLGLSLYSNHNTTKQKKKYMENFIIHEAGSTTIATQQADAVEKSSATTTTTTNNNIAAGFAADQRVHIFYYIWYQNVQHDKKYEHWNHRVLPHWQETTNKMYPQINTKFDPEQDDIGANFYPTRGTYSSNDKQTILAQFEEMKNKANAPVVVVSWWSMQGTDGEGVNVNNIIPTLMDCAAQVGVKIAFHLEPYSNRNALSTVQDVEYILDTFGTHPALFRMPNGKTLFYVYDSYLTSAQEWSQVLLPNAAQTIRNTKYDSIMIGLYVNAQDREFFLKAGFDGFYTYFAATGFTFGSTPENWQGLADFAQQNKLMFIPSVGPGYVDTRIRPWNANNARQRDNGKYYNTMWQQAINVKPDIISVTSYNEWHEGSQIEPAMHGKQNKQGTFTYENYGMDDDMYLKLTKEWAVKFVQQWQT